ncbi:MAG: hypothetical protein ACI9X0_002063 [Kiritimatiellia bacterium]
MIYGRTYLLDSICQESTPDSAGQTHLNCSCGIVPVVRPVLPEPARANCFDPGHAQGAISPLVASSSLEKRPYFRAGHHNMKLDAFALPDSVAYPLPCDAPRSFWDRFGSDPTGTGLVSDPCSPHGAPRHTCAYPACLTAFLGARVRNTCKRKFRSAIVAIFFHHRVDYFPIDLPNP